MIRAVFDTNVLVSYLLTHRPPISVLIDQHVRRDAFVLITAPELLEELERVLRYPKLRKYIHTEERARFLALVMALSQIVELPDQIPSICPDPDDDRVIACAVVGSADVIVSGDQHLLSLKQVGEIDVLTPKQFLALLNM